SFLFRLFFFNDLATPEIYTLSLHDALPIFDHQRSLANILGFADSEGSLGVEQMMQQYYRVAISIGELNDVVLQYFDETILRDDEDRKSTRLNSSHVKISYAVFCLKKKIINI